MANLIYVCSREPNEAIGTGTLERIADRITPELIKGRPHLVVEGVGESLCLTGPHGAVRREGVSACLGMLVRASQDWHRPGSPVPDGSFALVRTDGTRTELCSDAGGTRTLWYVLDERHFFASTSQRALVCLLRNLSLNRGAFAWFLSSGALGPTEAWDTRIRRLPRGARFVLDRPRWTSELHVPPVVFKTIAIKEAAAREELRSIIWSVLDGCDFQSARWVLPLSGGYDSRILLAALHESGFRPRTVTWGLAFSRTQRGNDAYVAKQLADHYGVVNDYRFTEMSLDSPREVVDAFLSAHGGTTDVLFPYLDGLHLWAGFANEGVDGIIRGDEGFGTWPRPELHHRFAQGIILLRDILDEATAEAISDGLQVIPPHLERDPAESLPSYGDRLVHDVFLPVGLASLSDVKAPFVEIANPLLSASVLDFIRHLPDRLRIRRNLYERLVEAISPPVPFAIVAADDSYSSFLASKDYAQWMMEELQGGFADRLLPGPFRAALLASLRPRPASPLESNTLRTLLKRIIPDRWVIAVRAWRPPVAPSTRTLAFRCALASRMVAMLQQDAACLPGPPGAKPA